MMGMKPRTQEGRGTASDAAGAALSWRLTHPPRWRPLRRGPSPMAKLRRSTVPASW
jgi:hypothetical protein